MVTRAELENDDEFVRGYHGIPHEDQLRQMSFVQLVSLLASCQKDSPKFSVVERELKKHLAKDQAVINRSNIILGACIGGILGLSGVVLGYYLKEVTPSSAVQQVSNSNLTVKPPVWNAAPRTPSVLQPANNPAPVETNAQPSKPHP